MTVVQASFLIGLGAFAIAGIIFAIGAQAADNGNDGAAALALTVSGAVALIGVGLWLTGTLKYFGV